MNHPLKDQTVNMSEFYSGMYTQPAPQQAKPRRRRKKNKGDGIEGAFRKRKLSEKQVNLLELSFESEHKLESERKDRLASELGLDPRQVAVWFQNRRARWKSKKMEEEYSRLKAEHDITVVEKCQLETEVLKLKEQLSDAEKQKQMLFEMCEGLPSNSPASSFSMDAMGSPFLGNFEMEGMGNIFYVPENYTTQGMDLGNLYI